MAERSQSSQRGRRFAVVLHSSGPSGGYVVRAVEDGRLPAPYSDVTPDKVYMRESAARACADRMNQKALAP